MRDELDRMMDGIAAAATPAPEDYTDPATGLLCCGKCHTAKQCRVTLFECERLMPCLCQCEKERREAAEAARREQERLNKIRHLKANALQDKALLAYTFCRDDGQNPAMKYARRYVEHWPEMKKRGQGLLLWGGVGTGKTFAAACIAHALTEQAVPVLMTNFSKILNSLSGMFSEDRNKYLASFNHFSLLIIDDLGIERNSEYALEQVYNVIDSRYLSRLPFIITTNLPLAELQAPRDLAHARIYDRVLERCTPICFNGPNYRKGNAAANKSEAAKLLND